MAKKTEPEAGVKLPHWLNKKQMAASCGVSTQAFEKWGVQPVARIGREAFFLVEDVIENRLARLQPNEGESDNQNEYDLNSERARLAHHQANKVALEEDVLKGNEKIGGDMVIACRQKLLALPTKLAGEVIKADSLNEAQALLKKHIHEALHELAEWAPG